MSSSGSHQILPCRTTWNRTAGALQGLLEKQCASLVVWRRWKMRACVLTPDGRLFVYAGLYAGRSFNLRSAESIIVRLDRKRNSVGYRQPTCLIAVRSATNSTVTLRVRGEHDVAEWSRRLLAHASLLSASRSLFVDDKNTQTTLGINSIDRQFIDRLRSNDEDPLPFVTMHEQIFRPHPPRGTRSLARLPVATIATKVRSPPPCSPTAVAIPMVPDDTALLSSTSDSPRTIDERVIVWQAGDSSASVTNSEPRTCLLSTTDGSSDTAWPDPPSNLQPPIAPESMMSAGEAMSEVRRQFAFLDNEKSGRQPTDESPAPSPENIECGICRSSRGGQLRRRFSGPL